MAVFDGGNGKAAGRCRCNNQIKVMTAAGGNIR
jgi:hypothetical protein